MGSEGQSRGRALRILIVRVGAMGDVLHGLPAVAGLRQMLPDCFIGWAVEPRWRALLQAGPEGGRGERMPIVDRLHEVRTREWKKRPFSMRTLRDVSRLRREIRDEGYDVCVDLQGSIRSAVIGRLAGAKRLVGAAEPRERQARWLYGEHVVVTGTSVIEQACELVGAGAGAQITAAAIALPRDVDAERWAQGTIGFAGTHAERRCVLLIPTCGWGAKEWGAERYRELAMRLAGDGVRILVNASAAGEPAAETIASDGNATIVVMNVRQLVALTRRVSLAIGGDTGPVHLAATLGRPVVALFGPTDPARNGPWFLGAKVKVLRDAASVTDHRRAAETEAGLARISVDEVYAAARAALERTHG